MVWSIECTEHLFDKPDFFQRVADGYVPADAWRFAHGWPENGKIRWQRRGRSRVCEGFFCPSLGTAADYIGSG